MCTVGTFNLTKIGFRLSTMTTSNQMWRPTKLALHSPEKRCQLEICVAYYVSIAENVVFNEIQKLVSVKSVLPWGNFFSKTHSYLKI